MGGGLGAGLIGWRPLLAIAEVRALLFPWTPLFLACGVTAWFAWPVEPSFRAYLALGIGFLVALSLWRWGPELAQPLVIAVACVLVGALAAGFRAQGVAAPVLDFRYYGPVQGRVVEIDRSQKDALRLTLDRVVLNRVSPQRTPHRVRVSLQGVEQIEFSPGQTVMLTGNLSAPQGASEPGGFDFRRMAFFDRLGAVGYTRTPVLLWQEAEQGAQWINRLRSTMGAGMRATMPSQAGAFAAGAMTGDRSGINQDTVQALRDSNLSHLLAISGMNLAFLIGFTFGLIRYGVALVPPVALRVDSRKVAAVISLGVAAFYLLLSGANVATERAFIMVAVMLGAILLDRRALTMRSVAISAVIILLWKPESLAEAGFQMSFAATVVLIAGFGALDGAVLRERLPRWVIPLFTLVLSSVLAGFATAPYSAAHFNRFTDYGLLANLMTVPMMGLVMASGAVAALVVPLGLDWLPLWVMEQAARWILFVAHWVAGLDGAVTPVIAPGPWVIPLITVGGLWAVLTRGRLRLAGVMPLVLAFGLWTEASRPALLISSDGALAGLMGPAGRALSAAKGAGFAAENWLRNDGDLAVQAEAAARPGFSGPKGARRFELAGVRGVVLTGKRGVAQAATACVEVEIVVMAGRSEAAVPGDCLLIDQHFLRISGSLALDVLGGAVRITPARGAPRIWAGRGEVMAATVVMRPGPVLAEADQ